MVIFKRKASKKALKRHLVKTCLTMVGWTVVKVKLPMNIKLYSKMHPSIPLLLVFNMKKIPYVYSKGHKSTFTTAHHLSVHFSKSLFNQVNYHFYTSKISNDSLRLRVSIQTKQLFQPELPALRSLRLSQPHNFFSNKKNPFKIFFLRVSLPPKIYNFD